MLPNNKANTAPDLAPETLEILREADLKFRKLLRNEPIFPDRLGVILAAGAATRFRPLTASKHLAERGELDNNEHYGVVAWNKASLPIANCPLLDFAIEDMLASGFRYIIINVSRLHAADSVIQAAGDLTRYGEDVAITFLVESQPSGTYGGVVKMLDHINSIHAVPDETDVAIFSGDIYTDQPGYEILRYHRDNNSAFTLMLNPIPEEMKGQFGTVELDDDNRIISFYEKHPDAPTNLNNSSRYVTKYGFLMQWAEEVTPVPVDKTRHLEEDCFFDFGLHIFSRHLDKLRQAGFFGFVSEKKWADLGRISDFHTVNIESLYERVVTRVFPGATVSSDCQLSGNYSIKGRSTISNGATITNSTIGEGWNIDGATVNRTVLMPLPEGFSYKIAKGVTLENCVVGSGNVTSSYNGKVLVFNGDKLIENDIW